ncbi:MAG: hypothetical protein DSY53_00380 [Persephonella sp.]|nr:MAG: hypothetical protein DSY53_00380 [Persephonella sp.]
MKKLKIFIFVLVFLTTFVFTFPLKTVVSYFLSSNNFLFSKIDGNIFKFNIKDLENRYVYIKNLKIDNKIFKQNIFFNKNLEISYKPFNKNLSIRFNKFDTSKVLKDKEEISAKLEGSIKIYRKDDYKILTGEGKIILRRLNLGFITLNGVRIKYDIKEDKNFSKVEADLKGLNINGKFTGKIVWKDKIHLKGNFSGRFFNQKVERDINEEFNFNFLDGIL